jgi:hypothetical protein
MEHVRGCIESGDGEVTDHLHMISLLIVICHETETAETSFSTFYKPAMVLCNSGRDGHVGS